MSWLYEAGDWNQCIMPTRQVSINWTISSVSPLSCGPILREQDAGTLMSLTSVFLKFCSRRPSRMMEPSPWPAPTPHNPIQGVHIFLSTKPEQTQPSHNRVEKDLLPVVGNENIGVNDSKSMPREHRTSSRKCISIIHSDRLFPEHAHFKVMI